MASFASFLLLSLFFLNFVSSFASFSASFPLTSVPIARGSSARNVFLSSMRARGKMVRRGSTAAKAAMPSLDYKSSFKYSMALVVTLPIGTPPQNQQMVLDTGSQLSWIQCHKKVPRKPPPTAAFDPSLSSSFSVLPCSHPMCKPRIPDFTLPTTCDQNRLCHYSYFYADGTLAEGNLVREKFSFSNSQTTPPLVLGCAAESAEAQGILGMNTGRLSFASQAKIQKFSYCVPVRQGAGAGAGRGIIPTGAFYLGRNPNSPAFQYINLLTFSQTQRRSPNLDPLAYTVGFTGIKIGGKKLNISAAVFRPDAGGSGQTIIDSGTQYTFLVDEAYNKVREEVVRLAGPKLKKNYVFAGALDMCFDVSPTEIGRLIGDMTFEFENRVDLLVNRDRISDNVEGGVHCLGIGRSESLGVASNIIGNFHQQNLWVEFDLIRRRVGFGKADCSKAV
ncbi:aspartic proteinase PCS1-like [Ipomoea triloba]|uniref:aspartic proteinase PCS1-like n=1 Tax=Ipomoea triloba TaxID=35885 RepID=UPI00125D5A07|nr:aspartic proteinase PCS1-like [Ipomoea triloba]